MSTTPRIRRLTARPQAWLAIVLVAMFANVIAFVTHDHASVAVKGHVEVCEWCVAHAGFTTPPEAPSPCDAVQRTTDEVIQTATIAPHSSRPIVARPRGPPLI